MNTEKVHNSIKGLSLEQLEEGRDVILTVGGYSMYPSLKPGSRIKVRKCPPVELQPGDIIVYEAAGKWIAHRLIRKEFIRETYYFTTKGDACLKKDTKFSHKALLGKVTAYQNSNAAQGSTFNNVKRAGGKPRSCFIAGLIFFIMTYVSAKLFKARKSLSLLLKALRFFSSGQRAGTITGMLMSALLGVLPLALIYMIKKLVDALSLLGSEPNQADAFGLVLNIVIITGMVFLALAVFSILYSHQREILSQKISHFTAGLVQKKYASLEMGLLENAKVQDQIHRAVREAGYRPAKMLGGVNTFVKSVIALVIIAVLLIMVQWQMFLLVLLAVLPGFMVRIYFTGKLYRYSKMQSTKEREAHYYNRVLTTIPFAKEMRLFQLFGFFRQRYLKLEKGLYEGKNKLLRRRAVSEILAQSFAIIVIFIVFALIVLMAFKGKLQTGSVLLFFLVFQRAYFVMKDLFQSFAGLVEDSVFVKDFFDFLQLPEYAARESDFHVIPVMEKGIRIQNLTFEYPGSLRPVLRDISMFIPKGSVVVLAGANGSGKTSLIKLLCGFYKPQQGRILLDDTDISAINPDILRRNISAVFQDFALYNLSAAENIALGRSSKPLSESAVREAARKAGIADVLEQLPLSYNNMLGYLFEKGEELSMGQWQKMAIARAFYRNSEIILMDEPTAALDALSAMDLHGNLKKLSVGKTVIMVSHRLQGISRADKIFFMDKGSIAEQGTHEELMTLKGLYYNAFQANQA